jgi:mono/diheme cytochrome c family protein
VSRLAWTAAALIAAPMPASAAGDVLTGLSLAQLMCTTCHTIAPGRRDADRGPPLPSLVNRLNLTPDDLRAWLARAHPPMPNFSLTLSHRQIDDIVAYLDTLRAR